jgi:hypothetical protein
MKSTHSEVYRGMGITITTTQGEEGWGSQATYTIPGQNQAEIEPAKQGHASEDEARRAALQAAVESIDRARTSIGKP